MRDIIEDLQDEVQGLKQQLRQKKDALWRKVVYRPNGTGQITDGQNKCLLELTLPAKAGKYLCKYSCSASAAGTGGWWIYYSFNCQNQVLLPNNQRGLYLPANSNSSYPFPLSGSVVVTLNGQENEQQRKLGLWHQGDQSYPSGISNICIEAYELQE